MLRKIVKRKIAAICGILYYPFFKKKDCNIKTINETIDFMNKEGHSIVRFGDGEFSIMCGKGIYKYQEYDEKLRDSLISAIQSVGDDKLLICIPDTITNLKHYRNETKKIWRKDFFVNRKAYNKFISNKYIYGNAFVSRPYMVFDDKSVSGKYFKRILQIFDNRDIVLVEGIYSRSGVGNDMFSNVKTLERILCPGENAFSKYNEIRDEVMKVDKTKLILLSIGPAGKKLVVELSNAGYWAIDIGHLDSEYEWFIAGCNEKTASTYKHTAECSDDNIMDCVDKTYIESIIKTIL